MGSAGATVKTVLFLVLKPSAAFDAFALELKDALDRRGIRMEQFEGGSITEGQSASGLVESWKRGRRLTLKMNSAPWQNGGAATLDVGFRSAEGGTRITITLDGVSGLLGDEGPEMLGWFVTTVASHLVGSLTTERFAGWYMDRNARNPSGERAVRTYIDPLYHWPGFFAILDELRPGKQDSLLDIGCGGGAFLGAAARDGCRATGLDHSMEQLRGAESRNTEAIHEGRLSLIRGDAQKLPFADGSFTCATMHAVFNFLDDPVAALAEIRRVLARGGRAIVYASSPSLRGTPASPEPFASRLPSYEAEDVLRMADKAGFTRTRLLSPDLESYAARAGIPDESRELFSGTNGGTFIYCEQSS